jgi:hypothetical protein
MSRRRVDLAGSYREAVRRRSVWAARLRAAKRAGTHGARIRALRLADDPDARYGIYIEPHDDAAFSGEA